MPIKRRAAKARKQLDGLDISDLLYGPGTCLFNGCGYLGDYGDWPFETKSDEVKQAVLTAMREDWERNRETVLAAWNSRSPHERYIAREYHGDPAEPWALTQFGAPK